MNIKPNSIKEGIIAAIDPAVHKTGQLSTCETVVKWLAFTMSAMADMVHPTQWDKFVQRANSILSWRLAISDRRWKDLEFSARAIMLQAFPYSMASDVVRELYERVRQVLQSHKGRTSIVELSAINANLCDSIRISMAFGPNMRDRVGLQLLLYALSPRPASIADMFICIAFVLRSNGAIEELLELLEDTIRETNQIER